MTDVHEVAADLRAEQEALDAIVADLTDEQWAARRRRAPGGRWPTRSAT